MNLFDFMQVTNPAKVKVRERERAEEEARLLDSTVVCVVPLLPVALARAESELEASVENLFDEGGSADLVDFAAGGGQEAEVVITTGVRIVAEENVAAERPRRPRKKRQAITKAGGSSHPPKKLRGATKLLVRMIFVVNLNPPLGSYSSHHSSTHASEAEGDSFIRSDVVPPVMTEAVVTSHVVDISPVLEMGIKVTSPVRASLFQDYDSTETVNVTPIFVKKTLCHNLGVISKHS
uniref:Uncharacterized protein n=1 Tax=Tanacetum cinerariifolium TaxID=118510 RepID=A0A6L2J4A7_TANCI|nr:hypothetical protein [Tanacetum cinerariifolium]